MYVYLGAFGVINNITRVCGCGNAFCRICLCVYHSLSRPPGIPAREFPGICLFENSRWNSRGFCPVLHFIFSILISSLDKCSYNARHRPNVKVHYNYVDSIKTLKKFVSRLQSINQSIFIYIRQSEPIVASSAHKIRFKLDTHYPTNTGIVSVTICLVRAVL